MPYSKGVDGEMLVEIKVHPREEAKEALSLLHPPLYCTQLCKALRVEKSACSDFTCRAENRAIGCCLLCMKEGDRYLTCEAEWCPTAKELVDKCLLK